MQNATNISANSFLQRAAANPTDVVCMDVPLLIRMLEFAREDAKSDKDLHVAAERLVQLSAQGQPLTMEHYDSIVAPSTPI